MLPAVAPPPTESLGRFQAHHRGAALAERSHLDTKHIQLRQQRCCRQTVNNIMLQRRIIPGSSQLQAEMENLTAVEFEAVWNRNK